MRMSKFGVNQRHEVVDSRECGLVKTSNGHAANTKPTYLRVGLGHEISRDDGNNRRDFQKVEGEGWCHLAHYSDGLGRQANFLHSLPHGSLDLSFPCFDFASGEAHFACM